MTEQEGYTYFKKRQCLKCGTKIGDQVHAARKFCPRIIDFDGSVKSCKDDFHSKKRKGVNGPYIDLMKENKFLSGQITKLLSDKGDKVSINDLDVYSIDLSKSKILKGRVHEYIFIEYKIQEIDKATFKIIKL
jgi:hypothetical protein